MSIQISEDDVQQKVGRFCPLYRIVWLIKWQANFIAVNWGFNPDEEIVFFNKILGMSTDRLLKKVLFSDALNGKRKSGRPLLSWRQAITQDIKFFDMTDIMLDDNYPQYTTSGQLKLEKRFSVVDDQKKSILRAKRDTRHKGYKLILVWRIGFLFLIFSVLLFVVCLFFFFTSIISFFWE